MRPARARCPRLCRLGPNPPKPRCAALPLRESHAGPVAPSRGARPRSSPSVPAVRRSARAGTRWAQAALSTYLRGWSSRATPFHVQRREAVRRHAAPTPVSGAGAKPAQTLVCRPSSDEPPLGERQVPSRSARGKREPSRSSVARRRAFRLPVDATVLGGSVLCLRGSSPSRSAAFTQRLASPRLRHPQRRGPPEPIAQPPVSARRPQGFARLPPACIGGAGSSTQLPPQPPRFGELLAVARAVAPPESVVRRGGGSAACRNHLPGSASANGSRSRRSRFGRRVRREPAAPLHGSERLAAPSYSSRRRARPSNRARGAPRALRPGRGSWHPALSPRLLSPRARVLVIQLNVPGPHAASTLGQCLRRVLPPPARPSRPPQPGIARAGFALQRGPVRRPRHAQRETRNLRGASLRLTASRARSSTPTLLLRQGAGPCALPGERREARRRRAARSRRRRWAVRRGRTHAPRRSANPRPHGRRWAPLCRAARTPLGGSANPRPTADEVWYPSPALERTSLHRATHLGLWQPLWRLPASRLRPTPSRRRSQQPNRPPIGQPRPR